MDIDGESKALSLDRSHTAYPVKDRNGKAFGKTRSILFDDKKELSLQIYNDRSSIEIVMNNEESLTMTYYAAELLQSWSVISNGQSVIHDVKIAD